MHIDLQLAADNADLPNESDFNHWATVALVHLGEDTAPISLCIRIVEEEESSALNNSYRNKQGPTNVLSFRADTPDFIVQQTKEKQLGDIVLCAPLVGQEAKQQRKQATAHWAHLTVHGVLHLLDHDHENPEEAEEMEGLEIAILQQLGFANPY